MIVSRPFTTSPRTPRHPRMHAIGLARIEIVSSAPRERHALTRSEMSSFGGRWSAAPPFTEGALPVFRKSRLTTDVDPMGFATLVRRDVALCARDACLPRASPCLRVFCGVPYGRPENTTLLWTTTFLPNSATRTDARARPYGLQCSSPARDSLSPTAFMITTCAAPRGEPCRSALPPR